jgi:YVTN family beta-propeller protein
MAYDGARIWVTDYTSSDVTVIDASGAVVKTFQLPPNTDPEGIMFDGRYIWVANNGIGSSLSNTVSMYDPASLQLVANYPVGLSPDGAAFDGTYVWVTNSHSHNVVKLNRKTGQVLRTYPTGQFPLSVIFDGRSIWVGSGADGDVDDRFTTGSVTELRAYGGVNLGTFPVGNTVRGLAFDGSLIWICNSGSNTVTRLRVSDGVRMGTYPTGAAPRSLAFDGERMWIANSGDNTVTVIGSSAASVLAIGSAYQLGMQAPATLGVKVLEPMQSPVDAAFSAPVGGKASLSTRLGSIVGMLQDDN